MKLLAIETSCDETAVAILEANQDTIGSAGEFTVLGNSLLSQIDIHKEFGGVYPMVAKREHAKNLVPILGTAFEAAGMLRADTFSIPELTKVEEILEREPGLSEAFVEFISKHSRPDIDAIAVTAGPGLEPALWVGVNFAKALSLVWNIPIVSVNHMEGHICAALSTIGESTDHITIPEIQLPLLSLLISGGHTELVLSKQWGVFQLIGATRDDAVGEAFDKVARMLGLPYPGGPEVSKLAENARISGRANPVTLPRPMINDPHFDFSFSGLKTAVLYMVKDRALTDEEKENIAWAFEDAAADVLYAKTARALEETNAKTLALGGGVSANTHIQRSFTDHIAQDFPHVRLAIPVPALTTDNAIMIGLAGFYHAQNKNFIDIEALRADGNRKLAPLT